jgi:histidine kinase/DNA gyrase B/HSP90-like ATPase/histidine kinase/PAS domain-containing protein
MDAFPESAPVGIGQIDANGTLTALNAEFARLFGLRGHDAPHRPLDRLPPVLDECWREIMESEQDGGPALRRWNVTVGVASDPRTLDVLGWASDVAHGGPVVQLLVSPSGTDGRDPSPTAIAERARLARDIHDGLAQDLWLAKLTASKLARHPSLDSGARALCDDLLRSIDSGLAEARTAVLAMRPDTEPAVTLSELVQRRVEEFSDRFGIRVECDTEEGHAVAPRVSIQMLRVLQEALTNVRKHANARRIDVKVQHRRSSVVLTVRDDGIGFDPTTVEDGYGRQSMRERAESIGARLDIASSPGRGTTVSLHVPVRRAVIRR